MDLYCEKCGNKLEKNSCNKCSHIRYENATSVAVSMIPVRKNNGELALLGVRRNIQPKFGELALPGGFQEIESIHNAGLREVEEETSINLLTDLTINSFHDEAFIRTTPDGRRNLIFLTLKDELKEKDINFSFSNEETQELVLITEDTKLAFPLHEEAVKYFFSHFRHYKKVLRPQLYHDDLD